MPVVIKADGLAAKGKGVLSMSFHIEAVAEFELMLQQQEFGEASIEKVVVEEFLISIELSVFVLTDGKNYGIAEAKDYKESGKGLRRFEYRRRWEQ